MATEVEGLERGLLIREAPAVTDGLPEPGVETLESIPVGHRCATILISLGLLAGCMSSSASGGDGSGSGGDSGSGRHPNANDRAERRKAEKPLQQATGRPTDVQIKAMCNSWMPSQRRTRAALSSPLNRTATIATTLDLYSHAVLGLQEEAAETVAARMFGGG